MFYCNNIWQYYSFYCIFDQINAAQWAQETLSNAVCNLFPEHFFINEAQKSVVCLSSPLQSGGFGCLCPERQIACQASAFTVAPCRYWDRAHAKQSLLGQGAMPVGNAHMCSALKEGDVLILGHTHMHANTQAYTNPSRLFLKGIVHHREVTIRVYKIFTAMIWHFYSWYTALYRFTYSLCVVMLEQ